MQAPARRPPNLRPKKSLCFSSGPKAGKNWWPSSRPLGRRSMGWYFLVFALFRSSSNWMRPTHIRNGNLLYSVYCLNVHLTQKHPQRHTQNNVTKCLGILWPRSFDKKKKINHHSHAGFLQVSEEMFPLGKPPFQDYVRRSCCAHSTLFVPCRDSLAHYFQLLTSLSLTSFKSPLKCHLIREAFPEPHFWNSILSCHSLTALLSLTHRISASLLLSVSFCLECMFHESGDFACFVGCCIHDFWKCLVHCGYSIKKQLKNPQVNKNNLLWLSIL